jgi:hypothetical protein
MESSRDENPNAEGSKPAFIVAIVFLILAAIAILTTYVKDYTSHLTEAQSAPVGKVGQSK